MAGLVQERQERGLVGAINKAFEINKKSDQRSLHNKPIQVRSVVGSFTTIVSAEKVEGRSDTGNEPYADVILRSTGKSWNLSLKGDSAGSLAGGGLEGLEQIIPGIGSRFIHSAYKAYVKAGYKEGDDVPDAYATIPMTSVHKIITGTKAMGGPVHYMYIGPMNEFGMATPREIEEYVERNFHRNCLFVRGRFITSSAFANSHKLVFRLRRRRSTAKFILETTQGGKDRRGLPMITHGRRIVITDSIPNKAFTVQI